MTTLELPCDLDAERATLGAILMSRDAIIPVAPLLRPDDFYLQRHAHIYAAALACFQALTPPDVRTVASALRQRGQLETVGGYAYLAELVEGVPTAYHVQHYAQPVIATAARRRLIQAGGQIAALGYAERPPTDLLADASRLLLDVAAPAVSGGLRSLAECIAAYQDRPERGAGLLTGIAALDRLTGGIGAGNLTLLAGIPGSGKTSLGVQVAWECAKVGRPAAVFSLEMTRDEVIERLVSYETGVPATAQRADTIADADADAIGRALMRMSEAPLYVEDERSLTATDVRLRALRLAHEVGHLHVVVVDYLGLLALPQSRTATTAQQLQQAAQTLKALAGELRCPVILCAQLNREVFHRPNKRPMLSDVREAGEAPADQVIVVMRPELFDPTDQPGVAILHLIKNRHGAPGDVPTAFDGPRFRFRNTTFRQPEGY